MPPNLNAVGNFFKTGFGNPFSASITMEQRGRLVAVGGLTDIFIPRDGSGDIVPLNSGIVGMVSKAIDFSSLLLLIPGIFVGPLAPLGAAIFGLALLNAGTKVINYGAKLIGSLLSFNLEGILTNGLAAAGAAICLLPVGKLFSQGLSKTVAGIKQAGQRAQGGVKGHLVGGAKYLYGKKLARGIDTLFSQSSSTTVKETGQGLLGWLNRLFQQIERGRQYYPRTPAS